MNSVWFAKTIHHLDTAMPDQSLPPRVIVDMAFVANLFITSNTVTLSPGKNLEETLPALPTHLTSIFVHEWHNHNNHNENGRFFRAPTGKGPNKRPGSQKFSHAFCETLASQSRNVAAPPKMHFVSCCC